MIKDFSQAFETEEKAFYRLLVEDVKTNKLLHVSTSNPDYQYLNEVHGCLPCLETSAEPALEIVKLLDSYGLNTLGISILFESSSLHYSLIGDTAGSINKRYYLHINAEPKDIEHSLPEDTLITFLSANKLINQIRTYSTIEDSTIRRAIRTWQLTLK